MVNEASTAEAFPVKTEEQRRLDLERFEINAAYEFSNGGSDFNDSSNTLGAKSSNRHNKDANGTVRSLGADESFSERTDRYGFIHEQKLPAALTENELKRNNIEKLREKKWIQMLKDWKSYSNGKGFDKLEGRVFKGIPNSMRNLAWNKFLDIDTQIKAQTGVYERMRVLARLYSLDLRQIDLDINRTFRNNLAYKKRYNQRQVQLYNILAAYSIYNTEIGYCQGMATVTALILMYLSDEEKTFWALSQLMSNAKYSMHGFFKQDFPKLIRYVDKHDMIIKTFLPKVHNKFIKYNITSLLYTTKWFLQCFLDALPFSLVLRVWDVFLSKGDIVILAMSYCILRLHKRRLLSKEFDMDKINDFLNHKLPDDFLYPDDVVMLKLEICIDKLQKHRFSTGPLLEPIPADELPKVPFGDFKKANKNDLITSLAQNKSSGHNRNSLDRSAAVELMARERLESDKKKLEEERKLRKQQSLAVDGEQGGLERLLNKTGEPIPNISDDDDDFEVSDSDDDLNPSKISEYDEDHVERESVISSQTGYSLQKQREKLKSKSLNQNPSTEDSHTSSQVSVSEMQQTKQLDSTIKNDSVSSPNGPDITSSPLINSMTKSPKASNDNGTDSGHKRSASDYENLSSKPSPVPQRTTEPAVVSSPPPVHPQVTKINTKPFNKSPQKSFQFTNILPMKSKKPDNNGSDNTKNSIQSSDGNIQSSFNGSSSNSSPQFKQRIPQSQSYIISPNYASTASIMSRPPPQSPTAYIANRARLTGPNIASIITNPSYYQTNSATTTTTTNGNNNNNNNSSTSQQQLNYEYIRSPHGIYTRVNTSSSLRNEGDSSNHEHSESTKQVLTKSPSFRIIPACSSVAGAIPQSTSSFIISSSSLSKTTSASKILTSHSSSGSMNVHPNLFSQRQPSSSSNLADNRHTPKQPPNTNKRTSSLRSIQNKLQNHFMSSSSSQSKLGTANATNGNHSNGTAPAPVPTPTKMNLQNHSMRIASIQQKQASAHNSSHSPAVSTSGANNNMFISNTNYPTISIISQGPAGKPPLMNGYQPIFHRKGNMKSPDNSKAQNQCHANSNDIIEQFDYI